MPECECLRFVTLEAVRIVSITFEVPGLEVRPRESVKVDEIAKRWVGRGKRRVPVREEEFHAVLLQSV